MGGSVARPAPASGRALQPGSWVAARL